MNTLSHETLRGSLLHALPLVFAFLCIRTAFSGTPTAEPTYSPTEIPAFVEVVDDVTRPVALHQLVMVKAAGDMLIRLKSFSVGRVMTAYHITSTPDTGSLYQLSQVFSSYGYEPKAGTPFLATAADTVVTGSSNRVYYRRPSPDAAGLNKWGTFSYYAAASSNDTAEGDTWGLVSTFPGTVTLVPPSGNLVGSDFLLSNEGWIITGNKAKSSNATYEAFSRGGASSSSSSSTGAFLNHYIIGSDDKINVLQSGDSDMSLWYFEAPAKFLGNIGISYGGTLKFSIGSFSGDFSRLNDASVNVVELECEDCEGPVGPGITLGFPISSLNLSPNGAFTGATKRVSISLLETTRGGGWLKASQNTLVDPIPASQCDIIQVLSRLSKIRILGDWTTWYETVALDNVQFANIKGQIPLCAMGRPDASVCTCA